MPGVSILWFRLGHWYEVLKQQFVGEIRNALRRLVRTKKHDRLSLTHSRNLAVFQFLRMTISKVNQHHIQSLLISCHCMRQRPIPQCQLHCLDRIDVRTKILIRFGLNLCQQTKLNLCSHESPQSISDWLIQVHTNAVTRESSSSYQEIIVVWLPEVVS